MNGVKVTRWVRKLIFEKPDEKKYTLPLRIYVGHPTISKAGYQDFANKLGEQLPAMNLVLVDKGQQNPAFVPPAKTVTEQFPWLIYVVLGVACVVLLGILGALVKQAIARHDAAEAKAPAAGAPSA